MKGGDENGIIGMGNNIFKQIFSLNELNMSKFGKGGIKWFGEKPPATL